MDPMLEDLVRMQITARVEEADTLRRGHRLVVARRLGRKADEAARKARLALSRTL
jgi:hypothetical protein